MCVEKKTLGQCPFWTSASTSVPGAPPSSGATFSQPLAPKPGRETAAPSLPAEALLCTCQPFRPTVWVAAPADAGPASAAMAAAAMTNAETTRTRARSFIRSPPETDGIAAVKGRKRGFICKARVDWRSRAEPDRSHGALTNVNSELSRADSGGRGWPREGSGRLWACQAHLLPKLSLCRELGINPGDLRRGLSPKTPPGFARGGPAILAGPRQARRALRAATPTRTHATPAS